MDGVYDGANESFELLLPKECTILLICIGCVVVLTVAGMMVRVLIGRKVGLSMLLATVVYLVVVMVGVSAWFITYERVAVAMEERNEALVKIVATDIKTQIRCKLDHGPRIASSETLLSASEIFSLNGTVTDSFQYINSVISPLRLPPKKGISLVYFTNNVGFTFGIYEHKESFLAWPKASSHEVPDAFTCRHPDTSNCTDHVCGVNSTIDILECSETCQVPATHDACYAKGLDVSFVTPSFGSISMSFNGTSMTVTPLQLTFREYDGRTRPWYQYTESVVWTEPYVFWVGVSLIGLTCTSGVKNLKDGTWAGVVAIDYTTGPIREALLEMQPTAGTHIIVVSKKGILISGNIPLEEISEPDGGLRNAWGQFESMKTVESRIPDRNLTSLLARGVNGETPVIFHEAQNLVVVQPFLVTGGLELFMILLIPYDDMLGEAFKASTRALMLVSIVSLACSIVLALTITAVLRPLRRLATLMRLLAWMRVDNCPDLGGSIFVEVASMLYSFDVMLRNLLEYKQYLPQSLIEVDMDNSEEWDPDHSLRSTAELSSSSLLKSPTARTDLFSRNMKLKKIGVACVNCHETHSTLKLDKNEFFQKYLAYMEASLASSRELSGVIDNVSGDRVRALFNASKDTANYRLNPCLFVIHVGKRCKGISLSGGVAAGEAVCGNAGCKGMRSFKSFGEVINCAMYLEHTAKVEGYLVVTEECIASHIESRISSKRLFRLTMYAKHKLLRGIISEVIVTQESTWMYDAPTDPISLYNEAVLCILDGKVEEAEELVNSSNFTSVEADQLIYRIAACKEDGPERNRLPFHQRTLIDATNVLTSIVTTL